MVAGKTKHTNPPNYNELQRLNFSVYLRHLKLFCLSFHLSFNEYLSYRYR